MNVRHFRKAVCGKSKTVEPLTETSLQYVYTTKPDVVNDLGWILL